MNTRLRPPSPLSLLIAFAVVVCFIAGIESQNATAQAVNGRIAFTSDSTVYTINSDGSGLTQLTPGSTFDRFPAWSPDGTRIAVGRTTFQINASEIYVMNADGSNQTRREVAGSNC
jgi:Tol biopolymer transport system component